MILQFAHGEGRLDPSLRDAYYSSPPTVPFVTRECPVCDRAMRLTPSDWLMRCPTCGLLASSLTVRINKTLDTALDDAARVRGIEELRRENNATILNRLEALGVQRGERLLDVGSAHGWFVEQAMDTGLAATGIEPDRSVAEIALARTVPTVVGFFPDALRVTDRFDVITFNDVLEHFPDVGRAVVDSARHLRPGGLLSVNIPSSQGGLYRAAALLARIGLRGPFERMWQIGLPSPHLWYFDGANLRRLIEGQGFRLVLDGRLVSVQRRNVWRRVHFDRRPTLWTVMATGLVWVLAPLVNQRPTSDIMHLVFRKAS